MENKKSDELKICLVGSSGGHLTHLYMLKPFWKDKKRFWVTFDKEDARSLLEGEPCIPVTIRQPQPESPDKKYEDRLEDTSKRKAGFNHIQRGSSCGPFFYLGKLFGAKLIYIEVFDRIDKPTMTGKMVYPIVDKFIVQWEEQKAVYPEGC